MKYRIQIRKGFHFLTIGLTFMSFSLAYATFEWTTVNGFRVNYCLLPFFLSVSVAAIMLRINKKRIDVFIKRNFRV